MSKPKKIAVRYIESNKSTKKVKKDDKADDAKALQEKLNANDSENCVFC